MPTLVTVLFGITLLSGFITLLFSGTVRDLSLLKSSLHGIHHEEVANSELIAALKTIEQQRMPPSTTASSLPLVWLRSEKGKSLILNWKKHGADDFRQPDWGRISAGLPEQLCFAKEKQPTGEAIPQLNNLSCMTSTFRTDRSLLVTGNLLAENINLTCEFAQTISLVIIGDLTVTEALTVTAQAGATVEVIAAGAITVHSLNTHIVDQTKGKVLPSRMLIHASRGPLKIGETAAHPEGCGESSRQLLLEGSAGIELNGRNFGETRAIGCSWERDLLSWPLYRAIGHFAGFLTDSPIDRLGIFHYLSGRNIPTLSECLMTGKGPIFVVDDDEDSRTMAKMILESRGYSVETCASGIEALEKMKSQKPLVVILDVMMPEMNGYDVLVHMRQRPETQNIPVIMLTAKGSPEEVIEGYQFGANYYIPKPFTTDQLIWGVKLYT